MWRSIHLSIYFGCEIDVKKAQSTLTWSDLCIKALKRCMEVTIFSGAFLGGPDIYL